MKARSALDVTGRLMIDGYQTIDLKTYGKPQATYRAQIGRTNGGHPLDEGCWFTVELIARDAAHATTRLRRCFPDHDVIVSLVRV